MREASGTFGLDEHLIDFILPHMKVESVISDKTAKVKSMS
jgi:hypothetical protein